VPAPGCAAGGIGFRILDAGDTALTIEFGERIDRRLQAAVAALDAALAGAIARGELPGVVEAVPTFRSLTVIYDPLRTTRGEIEPRIRQAIPSSATANAPLGRRWQLPVCYGDEIAACGPDLDELATACGLPPADVVRLHAGGNYEVCMLGFLPGFAFLGGLAERLSLPRRSEPRLRVPAGSVATAGTLTAIYPCESPGGWHLIGACPVPLFSAGWAQPALLQPGDQVRFRPVGAAEYHELAVRMAARSAVASPPLEFLVGERFSGR